MWGVCQTWVQAHLVAKTIGCSDQGIHDSGFGCGMARVGHDVELGLGVLALSLVESRQVVEARGDVRVLRPERLLPCKPI